MYLIKYFHRLLWLYLPRVPIFLAMTVTTDTQPDGRTDGQIGRSILYCLRCTPYIPSPSLTCSLCLLFSEVYWLFRSKAKMRRFRQQPQKQPAIRGIFISIHGVSVSACLRERERVCLLSAPTVLFSSRATAHSSEDTAARFWCGGVCVFGGYNSRRLGGWSAWGGCQEETETPTEAVLTEKQSTSLWA